MPELRRSYGEKSCCDGYVIVSIVVPIIFVGAVVEKILKLSWRKIAENFFLEFFYKIFVKFFYNRYNFLHNYYTKIVSRGKFLPHNDASSPAEGR